MLKGIASYAHHKDIILKTRSSPIVLPHNREDESTPTFENTTRSTGRFAPLSQNPPKNPPSTQSLEHHSPQHHSPLHSHSSKSPHTIPLQNPPTEQASHQRSPPHVHSLKPPHTTPPLRNPPTEQAPQQRSPPHVHSLKPPHTTSPPQNPPIEQAPQ
jgi:hypothetical protein